MNMIVCIKQVIDPEAPPASFKIDAAANKVVPPPGVSPIVDPYGEYATEAALQIKDAQGGKITAISLGTNLLRDVVKKPLSMQIPESLVLSLDELAKRTGRKKNLLLAASLNDFLKATAEEQERIIRKYLDTH